MIQDKVDRAVRNLENIDIDRLKAFSLVFLAFVLFAHWNTAGDPIVFTTQSLAENSSLSIDGFEEKTPYSSQLGESHFSEKPPLTSLAALPPYYIVETLSGSPSQEFHAAYFPRSPDTSTKHLRLLSVISLGGLTGLLSVWLIFKILNKLKPENESFNLLTAVFAGVGSLIFAYSTVLSTVVPSTFLMLAAIYLWIIDREDPCRKKQAAVYLLLGLGVSTSYFLIVPTVVLLAIDLYRSYKNRTDLSQGDRMLGLFTGLSPLLIYNLFTGGRIFDFSLASNYLVPELPHYSSLLMLTISPETGLLFYSPLAVLGVLGLRNLYNEDRELASFIALTGLLSLIAVASTSVWTGSITFGPKHLVPASTLMFIPLGVLISEIGKRKRYTVYGVGAVSVFIQLLSTQPWRPQGHIINYYLLEFPSQGFQSPLIRSLAPSNSLNMVLGPYPSTEFYLTNIVGLNTIYSHNHLVAGILLLGLLLFYQESILKRASEISARVEKKHLQIAVGLVFLTGLSAGPDLQPDGWYPEMDGESFVWSRESPSFIINSYSDGEILFRYELDPIEPRNISMILNGEEVEVLELEERHTATKILDLMEGPNSLEFRSNRSCTTIGETTEGNDVRCTHVGLRNLELSRPFGDSLYPAGDFVEEDDGVSVEDGTSFIVDGDANFSLSFNSRMVGGEGTVEIYLEDKKIDETDVDAFGSEYNSPYFENQDLSELRIDYSCKTENSCENLLIQDLYLEKYENQPEDTLYRLGQNWYQDVEEEEHQWSYSGPSINIYNYRNETVERALWLEGRSYSEPSVTEFRLNGEDIGSRLVSDSNQRTALRDGRIELEENRQFFNIELEPGENILEIDPRSDCISSDNIDDVRCMSYGLKSLYLTEPHPDNLQNYTSVYGPENSPLKPGEDSVKLFTDHDSSLALDAVFRSFDGEAVAKINSQEISIEPFRTRLSTPYLEPDNGTVEIEFECIQNENCGIEVEELNYHSSENHPMENLYRYGYNWYQEIETEEQKWSTGESSIYLYNLLDEPVERKLDIELSSFNRPRETSFYLNGEHLKDLTVEEKRSYEFNITVKPGENIFELKPDKCTSKGQVNDNDDIRCASLGVTEVDQTNLIPRGQLSEDIGYSKDENWREGVDEEGYRWSYNKSTVILDNNQDETVEKALWIEGKSYSEPRITEFVLNSREIGTRLVSSSQKRTTVEDGQLETAENRQFFNIELEPGENILEISQETDCPPSLASNEECLSYGVRNMYLTEPHPDNLTEFNSLQTSNDGVLDPGSDSITMFTSHNTSLALEASLRATDGKAVAKIRGEEFEIDIFPTRLSTPYLEPDNGTVEIEFECIQNENCGIEVEEISFNGFDEHPPDRFFRYGSNWYTELEREGMKWGKDGDSTIYFYSFINEPENRSIELELSSFNRPRETSFYLNGEHLETTTVEDELEWFEFNSSIKPGENIFEIKTDDGCTKKEDVHGNDDIRCVSLGNTEILY